jgi:hypothetical protein
MILRILQRDITINVHRPSCKVPLLLADFNQNLTFSTDFQKSSNIKLDEKPSSGNRVVFHVGRRTDRRTDKKQREGQTDRHNEASSRFSQFCERALKTSESASLPRSMTTNGVCLCVCTRMFSGYLCIGEINRCCTWSRPQHAARAQGGSG